MRNHATQNPSGNRIVFLGIEETGYRCLKTLLEMGANVVGVFTLNDEKARKTIAPRSFDDVIPPHLPLYKIGDANTGDVLERLHTLQPDLLYQVSWSQLLRPEVLAIPSKSCVGMHLSLLPKHRGRAPIPWTIIFDLRRTGMTLFHLSESADLGDVIGQVDFAVGPDDDAADVYERGVRAAEELIRMYHGPLLDGTAPRRSQDPKRSDYWPKRTPQDGLIDWNRTAESLYAWVRALTRPFPGAFTFRAGRKVLVWRARPEAWNGDAPGGRVLEASRDGGILVATGEGALRLDRLQLEDEQTVEAGEFAARHSVRQGEEFG